MLYRQFYIFIVLSIIFLIFFPQLNLFGATVDQEKEYRAVLHVVERLKQNTDRIKELKREYKVQGTEHGLLELTPGVKLTTVEQKLFIQENRDRRSLFEFIAKHSIPTVDYEYVSNEYAKNIWKEWPPRQ